jgi:site-specific DNA recombinase
MRYLIYGRVSPKGSDWVGSETSIPDQLAQCRAYVLARDPAATFQTLTDEFFSAGSSKRPAYRDIVAQLKTNTATWDVLVVRHIDRLSRSLADATDLLRLLESTGRGLISTTQQLDLATPTGRAMLHIILVFAEWERAMASERTKMRMVAIAEKGLWPVGHPPIGYRRGAAHDNKLYIDPAKAETVRAIYRKYLAGSGTLELAREYHMPKNTVIWTLKNPAYLGIIRYAGKDYPGQHEPIIAPETYRAVQAKMPGNLSAPRPAAQKYPYLLTGLLYCDCGRAMTPASSHGRNAIYHYYRCTDLKTCKSRVKAADVETEVLDALRAMQPTAADITAITAAAEKQYRASLAADMPALDDIETALSAARQTRDRLLRMFVDGLVSAANADMLNAELTRANTEVQDLTGRRDALKAATGPTAILYDATEIAQNLCDMAERIDSSDPETLRRALKAWVQKIEKRGEDWEIHLHASGIGGSSNRPKWLRQLDLDAPVLRLGRRVVVWLAA